MKKLLIAEASEKAASDLAAIMHNTCQITCCYDGREALELLQSLRPDILVINLSLPHLDGLYILEATNYKPAIILPLVTEPSLQTQFRLGKAGASYVIRLPCNARCVAGHIQELLLLSPQSDTIDPQAIVEEQLLRMGFPSHPAGFSQLRVGIPLFAQDMQQHMKKELYPAIAAICGKDNPEQVEHTIRDLIKKVWAHRDRTIWDPLFPGREKYPPNKVFIKTMALWLNKELKEKTRS